MAHEHKRYFEFGPYRLDPAASVLTRNGELVVLGPKAVETLAALVRQHGQVVSKEDLMKAVWPDAFVEDANLNVQISALRKALEDSAENPTFIETAPRRGYRFLPQVREVIGEPELPAQSASPSALPKALVAVRITRRVLAVGVLVGVAAVFAFTLWQGRVQTASAPTSTRFLVGVLPFANLSGNAEQEYLSDGLTEELITELGRLNPRQMGVIARSSMMPYKNKGKDVHQVAQELGLRYVLEGSVLRVGNRLRVTAKLIQASDQSQVWANQYEREVKDLIDVQQDVARAVARETFVRVSPETQHRLEQSPSIPPEAYEAYLRGRFNWWMRNQPAYARARANFEEALRIDANFARAYAGLADTYFGGADARKFASKAVELDGTLAEAHASLAFALWGQLDWKGAEVEFRRALELDPYYATARHWYGYVLLNWGRTAEALEQLERARETDPLNVVILTDYGQVLYWVGQYDRARAPLDRALEIDPAFPWARFWLGRTFEAQGKLELAAAQYQLAEDQPLSLMDRNSALACLYLKMGQRQKALPIIRKLEASDWVPRNHALVLAALGENQQAIRVLEDATRNRPAAALGAWMEPGFAALRADPRFQNAIAKAHPPAP